MKKLQLTLALCKPDITVNDFGVKAIRDMIQRNNFYFIKSKKTKLTLEDAMKFYKEHEKKFFYNRLTFSMSSGPIWCHILAKENAIADWRKLMGPTKVFKTIYEQPNTIRGRFGASDTRNSVHGSDSEENAKKEIGIFFPGFDVDLWYQNEMDAFIKKQVEFNEDLVEHRIKK